MMEAIFVVGDPTNPAVTHIRARHIVQMFGVRLDTLKGWKRKHGFPRAEFVDGQAYYSRAAVAEWRNSSASPRWLRGEAEKPTGRPAEACQMGRRACVRVPVAA